jgi:hypothetical protein
VGRLCWEGRGWRLKLPVLGLEPIRGVKVFPVTVEGSVRSLFAPAVSLVGRSRRLVGVWCGG